MFHIHFHQWHQKRYKVICNENNQRLVFSVSQKKWLEKACDEREKLQSCPEEDGFYWLYNNVLDVVKRWHSRYFSFILFQGFCDVFCHVGQNFQYTPSYRLVLHPSGGAKFLWKKWRSCDAGILCSPPVGVAKQPPQWMEELLQFPSCLLDASLEGPMNHMETATAYRDKIWHVCIFLLSVFSEETCQKLYCSKIQIRIWKELTLLCQAV